MIVRQLVFLALALMLPITGGGSSYVASAQEIRSKFVRQNVGADTVIVFVHGMMGDGVSTWTNPKTNAYWPEMLTKDPAFDGSDVYVYSYGSGFWATMSIDELAENMRADLSAHGVSNYKKIIFLSHSMGGLITRAYLLKNKDTAARTLFTYFFSTPTTGSQIASLLRFLAGGPWPDGFFVPAS
jgi:triacylglycerol esterase/lipase EstA (alpha/beta hydrolase family)